MAGRRPRHQEAHAAAPLLGVWGPWRRPCSAPWLGGAPARRAASPPPGGPRGGTPARRPRGGVPGPRVGEGERAGGALASDTPARHPHGGALVVREGLGEGAYAPRGGVSCAQPAAPPPSSAHAPKNRGRGVVAARSVATWPRRSSAHDRAQHHGRGAAIHVLQGQYVFLSSFNGHSKSRLTEWH